MTQSLVRWCVGSSIGLVLMLSSTGCDSDSKDATSNARVDTGTGAGRGGASGSGGSQSPALGGAGGGSNPFANCSKGRLEDDRGNDVALAGPGVDSATGTLNPGTYVISTTYLALQPDKAQRAGELSGPVMQALPTMRGLVAVAASRSDSCAALRTLTVWETADDLHAFVGSPAHLAAMSEIGSISRGASNTTSWTGTAEAATWEAAAAELATSARPDF